MARKKLRMYDYNRIIEGLRALQSERGMARNGIASRNTIAAVREVAGQQGWLDASQPPPSPQQLLSFFPMEAAVPVHHSKVEPHRERVQQWLNLGYKPKQIHRKLTDLKRTSPEAPPYEGSLGSVKRFVANLVKKDPKVFAVVHYEPGEAAQVDFGTGPKLPDPYTGVIKQTQVFVMTLCHSRHMYAELVWDQKIETWLRCHVNAFQHFGGLPRKIIIDNLKAAITRACRRDPIVQKSYEGFAAAWGFKIDPNPPASPWLKGRVESGVKYVKGAVFCRDFRTFAEAQEALETFVMEEAGNRIHGTTQQRPLTVFAQEDLPAMLTLPDPVPELVYWAQVQVHKTIHLYLNKGYYSVPYQYVQQKVWVKAGLKIVEIYDLNFQLLTMHAVTTRPGQFRTNQDHYPPDKRDAMELNGEKCLQIGAGIGVQVGRFLDILLADRVLERLGAAQGVLKLRDKYGGRRLNDACARAIEHDVISFTGVKRILEKGLDQFRERQLGAPEFAPSRFSRSIAELLKEAM